MSCGHEGIGGRTINKMAGFDWKCIEIVNPTITKLFCINLNLLQSHQADLIGYILGGGEGGGVRTPLAYGPGTSSGLVLFFSTSEIFLCARFCYKTILL